VATIVYAAENSQQAAWMDRQPAVIVNIQRQPGANIIGVVDRIERLLPQLRSTGALINVEMLARARKLGATVTEVGVHHYPRETGQPTGGNPAVIVRAFKELLELWRELR